MARWVLCQAMSKILTLLLQGGRIWDHFSSDRMGTVTPFPPALWYGQQPWLARVKSNSLHRHKKLTSPWL